MERALFASRWLLLPIYAGLALSIGILLVKFVMTAIDLVLHGLVGDPDHLVLGVLGLVDLSLVGNLVLMVVLAGYENFVSHLQLEEHRDRPAWIGHIGYGELKLKLVASVIVISVVHLLEDFVNITTLTNRELGWRLGLHLTFVATGVLLAVMDRLTAGAGHAER